MPFTTSVKKNGQPPGFVRPAKSAQATSTAASTDRLKTRRLRVSSTALPSQKTRAAHRDRWAARGSSSRRSGLADPLVRAVALDLVHAERPALEVAAGRERDRETEDGLRDL